MLRHDEPMCVHGMSGFLEVLGNWSWGTIAAFLAAIAAFLAAAATLYVGQTQINERRRLVGREVIAQLSAAAQGWNFAAFQLRHQHVSASKAPASYEYIQAAQELSRALLAVQMTCNDEELATYLRGMVAAASEFSARADRALSGSENKIGEQDAAILEKLANKWDTTFGEFLGRAIKVYAAPSRTRYRVPQWLRDESPAPK